MTKAPPPALIESVAPIEGARDWEVDVAVDGAVRRFRVSHSLFTMLADALPALRSGALRRVKRKGAE